MKAITKIFISVVGIYSSQLLAAPEWEQKNYSGGAYVCHKGVVDQISLRINDAINHQQLASDGHT